jgi:uncharacterized protein (DUF488 family)
VQVFTIGHGARTAEELVACLTEAGVETLIDVRRFPGSRRHPQFDRDAVSGTVEAAGIAYVHAEALGGRRSGGSDRFPCIRVAAFRSYAAWMGGDEFRRALADALGCAVPCFMCAETLWWRCHRRLIADLLVARGHPVVHLIRPGETQQHQLGFDGEIRDGRLYLCGHLVA